MFFFKLGAIALSSAPAAVNGFAFNVAASRATSYVLPTAPTTAFVSAMPLSSYFSQQPYRSREQQTRAAAAGAAGASWQMMAATTTTTTVTTGDAPAHHHQQADQSAASGWRMRRTAGMKVLKSAGVSLAWYAASSAAAAAVSSATGGAVKARNPRRKLTGLPLVLIAFALSRKDVKKRTRLEGVVPRDPESVKLLADEAEDLALSWGKPAGLLAYTSVDFIILAFFSRLVGFPFKELFSAQRLVHLQEAEFWVATILASAFGYAFVWWSRRIGQGYLRSVCASALSPTMQRLFIRPAKAVASVAGMGDGWDLGLTEEERKARPPSIELRKRLSTFRDPDFHGDGGEGYSGGAAYPPPPPPPSTELGLGDVNDDGAPPDLKRSS
ncbi:unnamed protein product [Pylaiella littoralis]